MRWLAVSVVTLLCVSMIPVSSAGGNGLHWNGYGLERGAVPNVVLTDHNSEPYSLHTGDAEVNVVAFIFTTCVDACPILTHNLAQAHAELDDVNHQFISITVDPEVDTPSVLKAYMEDRSVNWPHLSGSYEEIKAIWDNFQINVTVTEIDTHNHTHSSEETNENGTESQNGTSENDEHAHDDGESGSQNDDHDHGDDDSDREEHDHDQDHSDDDGDREEHEHDHDHGDDDRDRDDDDQDHSDDDGDSDEHNHDHGDDESEDDNGTITLISHSTQTFILDSNWKPKVVFVGYMWDVDVFVEDVVRAAELHSESSDHDTDLLPGFTFAVAASGLGLAIIATTRDE